MRVFNDIIQNTQKNSEFSELRDLGLWITKKYFAQQKEKGCASVFPLKLNRLHTSNSNPLKLFIALALDF